MPAVSLRRMPGGSVAGLVLRLLVAAGLAVDAYVHADLAPVYDGIRASISQGDLFRLEAGAAAAAAVIVLAAGRRAGFGVALAVAASGLAALLLYRYVDVGQLGPLPNMYEPSWFGEKTAAAVAEAAVVAFAAGGLLWALRHRAAAPAAASSNRPDSSRPDSTPGTPGSRLSRRRLGLTAAGALVAGIAVAGFAGGGTGTAAPAGPPARAAAAGQQVTIVGNNSLRFAPMVVRLHTGTVRITLMDMGAYPHNVVIPALGITSPTVTGDPGGTQVSFSVTFTRPGSYPFHCQYHQSAGMTGTFVVS
jgi:plastocyanin